jgi:hypothetical protein
MADQRSLKLNRVASIPVIATSKRPFYVMEYVSNAKLEKTVHSQGFEAAHFHLLSD